MWKLPSFRNQGEKKEIEPYFFYSSYSGNIDTPRPTCPTFVMASTLAYLATSAAFGDEWGLKATPEMIFDAIVEAVEDGSIDVERADRLVEILASHKS